MRFPEFSGEWENTELQYIAPNICSGKDKPTSNGTVALYGSTGIIGMTRLASYNEEIVLVARVGANAGQLQITTIPCGVTDNTLIINAKEWNRYIYYYLQHYNLNRLVFGSGQPLITGSMLKKLKIIYGEESERNKIVNLLCLLDERIATQNKIIEDLKKLKSAISLKMLHSDSWEQFKIQDIASIGRGRVISSVEISQQENPLYPVYSSQTSNDGIMGYLDDFMFEGEYISWTTDGANAGTVFYRNGKFNCTNVCGLLKLKKGFDAHFVSLVLAEATRMYVSTNLANPKLMNNTMGNIQIRLPKLEEQKRISVVFRKLHGLLETHNSLIIKYSKQKQYLLSQMFI